MLKIIPSPSTELTGFEKSIIQYLQCELPNVQPTDCENLIDLVLEQLFGTKNTRLGPLPNVESQVHIKETVRLAVKNNLPIPILVAWGGVKMSKIGELDTAEIAALKTLLQFNTNVRKFYSPGLHINIRIEDTGAWNLYQEFHIVDEIEKYSKNFRNLVGIVGPGILNPIRESELMDLDKFNTLTDEYGNYIFEYINYTDLYPAQIGGASKYFDKLNSIGWYGAIPEEQRSYYRNLYTKLYPDQSPEYYTKLMANYLGGAKSRYELNGRAAPTILENSRHISMSFVAPIPGAPTNLFGNTIYIRTTAANQSKTHIPAWRAFGYLEIDNAGYCTSKIVNHSRALELIADEQIESEIMLIKDSDTTIEVPVTVNFKVM